MSSPTPHDFLEVFIGLVEGGIKNDAQELDADFVLLLKF